MTALMYCRRTCFRTLKSPLCTVVRWGAPAVKGTGERLLPAEGLRGYVPASGSFSQFVVPVADARQEANGKTKSRAERRGKDGKAKTHMLSRRTHVPN